MTDRSGREEREPIVPSPEQIGRAIRQLRVKREMTLEALAKSSGLHWTYVSGIERGRRNPTMNVMAAVAASLDVTTAQLVLLAEDAG